jgi:hypothetical protein
MSPLPSTTDRLVTVISDGFVLQVACDDDRFDAVVAALQDFLVALDVDVAIMTMESGSDIAEQVRVERVQRAAMRN